MTMEEQAMRQPKALLGVAALALVAATASAQEPPRFYKDTYPSHALAARLQAEEVLVGSDAKLDAKTRELIALAVAAQIPCTYCVYFHDKAARAEGASEAEVREAVAASAHVRHWSTVLNGMAYDFAEFKAELDDMMSAD
jgi:AhpD family alkylhydroperoxidase